MRYLIFALAVALLLIPKVATAQMGAVLKTDVFFVRHHADGWVFAPAVRDGRVVGFLAWVGPGVATPGNIKLLWFERGGGATWDISGWSIADKGGAVNFVRDRYADPSIFDRDGELVGASIGIEPAEPDAKVVGAFFENDPIGIAVNGSPEAADLAEVLGQAGYPVAAGDLKTSLITQPCPTPDLSNTDKLMIPIVRQVEAALFTASSLTVVRAAEGPIDPCVAAWPCAGCTIAYGNATVAPAAVTTTTIMPVGARCKCESRTPATATATYTGKTVIWCEPCTGPTPVSGIEYCAEDITCPVPLAAGACPGGGCGLFVP